MVVQISLSLPNQYHIICETRKGQGGTKFEMGTSFFSLFFSAAVRHRGYSRQPVSGRNVGGGLSCRVVPGIVGTGGGFRDRLHWYYGM